MTTTVDHAPVRDRMAELDLLQARLTPRVGRAKPRRRVRTYIEGLL